MQGEQGTPARQTVDLEQHEAPEETVPVVSIAPTASPTEFEIPRKTSSGKIRKDEKSGKSRDKVNNEINLMRQMLGLPEKVTNEIKMGLLYLYILFTEKYQFAIFCFSDNIASNYLHQK